MTDQEIIDVVERHCQEYDRATGKIWMSYSRAKIIKVIRELLGQAHVAEEKTPKDDVPLREKAEHTRNSVEPLWTLPEETSVCATCGFVLTPEVIQWCDSGEACPHKFGKQSLASKS